MNKIRNSKFSATSASSPADSALNPILTTIQLIFNAEIAEADAEIAEKTNRRVASRKAQLRDSLDHFPDGLIQADKHRPRDNVVADVEFGDFGDRGQGGDVAVG